MNNIAMVAIPIGTLVVLYVAFFSSLRSSSSRLPDVVRTLQGQRVSRQVYLTTMVFVGLWGPLFPTGLMLVGLVQHLNASIVIFAAWAACVLLAIVIAVHWKTVSVNKLPESAG